MSKLIFANIHRIKKDIPFWLCVGSMFAIGLFMSIKVTKELPLDSVFFAYAVIVGLVSSVFCGLFIGTETGDGAIRNKLIVGHTKQNVYMANLIACIVAGFVFCLAFIIPMLAIGTARLGFFTMTAGQFITLLVTTLALSAAYSSIFTLISMLCRNKAIIAVACILCFIALFLLGAAFNLRLQEPEFLNNYVMTIDGVGEVQNQPNPDYLTGAKREVFQFFLDFIPGGQSIQFAELTMVHYWQLPVYSLIISALTTLAGVVLFKRKNVN